MKKHRNRPLAGWIMLAILAAVMTGALFGFEYLGSEQDQQLVNQPVDIPVNSEKSE